ncbi:MAG: MFS transporter [Candidatus Eremiobacteraeota bacterium]|nr:MFS transporter [Candidatus Eremiobacteraeota bacterium]
MATATARPASVFRSSAFARFYAGQAFSYLGDGLRTLAIPLLVFRLTGSGQALGLTWGLELLPYAFVSLIAGSLGDRVDRRRLMLVCDALRFVVMALFTVLFATGHLALWMIYVGVLVLAIGGSIFLGAQTASIPFLLGKDRAKAAVAALQATEQSVGLIAPPVGGMLFAIVGPLPALAVNAVTYLTSQVAIASVRTFGPEEPSGLPSLREVAADVATGWRFLWDDRAMRLLSLASGVANFLGSIGFVTLIPYFKRAFGTGDHVIGLAFGCFAAATALGCFIAGRTHWPTGPALIVAYLADGIGWLPLPWTNSLALAVGGVSFSGVCAGFFVTNIVAWRMRVIPEDLTGRVFGVARLLVLVGILPGSLLGGWCADHLGVRTTMLISAIGYFVFTFVIAASPTIRAERR